MVADDIQSLFNGVLGLVCRVPIDALWPQRYTGGDRSSSTTNGGECRRPATYGEAYQSLLQDQDLLALGLHRAPISGENSCSNLGKSSTGWTGLDHQTSRSDDRPKLNSIRWTGSGGGGGVREEKNRTIWDEERGLRNRCCCCPSGSQFLAIACPSSSFPLRDGDCVFVLHVGRRGRGRGSRLRRVLRPCEVTSQGVAAKMAPPVIATASATGVADAQKEAATVVRGGLLGDDYVTTRQRAGTTVPPR